MSKASTLSPTELKTIRDRINELEATDRVLVGSDEGTHGKPATHRIYETITGERYATRSFGGSNATRLTVEEAEEQTDGRIRTFPEATAEIRDKRRELKELRSQLDAV